MTICSLVVQRDPIAMELTLDELKRMLKVYDDINIRAEYDIVGYDETHNQILFSKLLSNGTRTYVVAQMKLKSVNQYVEIDHLWILNSWWEHPSIQRASAQEIFNNYFPNEVLLAHNQLDFELQCLYYDKATDEIRNVRIFTANALPSQSPVSQINAWRKSERFIL